MTFDDGISGKRHAAREPAAWRDAGPNSFRTVWSAVEQVVADGMAMRDMPHAGARVRQFRQRSEDPFEPFGAIVQFPGSEPDRWQM